MHPDSHVVTFAHVVQGRKLEYSRHSCTVANTYEYITHHDSSVHRVAHSPEERTS